MYYENKKEKRRKNFMAILFMVIVIALLASVNLRLQFLNENNLQHDYSTQKLETVKEVLEEEDDYAFLEEASESIVGISKLKTTEKSFLNPQNIY